MQLPTIRQRPAVVIAPAVMAVLGLVLTVIGAPSSPLGSSATQQIGAALIAGAVGLTLAVRFTIDNRRQS